MIIYVEFKQSKERRAKRWCKDGRINELKVLMGSKGVGIWVYERQSYKVVDCVWSDSKIQKLRSWRHSWDACMKAKITEDKEFREMGC